MKITKVRLKQIIKEELTSLREVDWEQETKRIGQAFDEPGSFDQPEGVHGEPESELEEEPSILRDIEGLLAGWTSEQPDAKGYHIQLEDVYKKYTS